MKFFRFLRTQSRFFFRESRAGGWGETAGMWTWFRAWAKFMFYSVKDYRRYHKQ